MIDVSRASFKIVSLFFCKMKLPVFLRFHNIYGFV